MEHWQNELDKWLTTPPEEQESKLVCADCGNEIYPDEKFYNINGRIYCEDCIEDYAEYATEEQCYE